MRVNGWQQFEDSEELGRWVSRIDYISLQFKTQLRISRH